MIDMLRQRKRDTLEPKLNHNIVDSHGTALIVQKQIPFQTALFSFKRGQVLFQNLLGLYCALEI